MADVKMVNTEEFKTLLAGGGVMMTDFFADWCMPCKRMAPVVEQLAADYDGRVTVTKVNVDDSPELAVMFGIQSIPTLLIFRDGEKAGEFVGVRSYDDLAVELNKFV